MNRFLSILAGVLLCTAFACVLESTAAADTAGAASIQSVSGKPHHAAKPHQAQRHKPHKAAKHRPQRHPKTL